MVDESSPAVVFKGEDNWILWSDERAITDCINHVLKIRYSKSPKVQTNCSSTLFWYYREHHQADLEDDISTHGLAVGDYGLLVLTLHILNEKLQLLRFSVKSFSDFDIFSKKFFSFWIFEIFSDRFFSFWVFEISGKKFLSFKCFRMKSPELARSPFHPSSRAPRSDNPREELVWRKTIVLGFSVSTKHNVIYIWSNDAI